MTVLVKTKGKYKKYIKDNFVHVDIPDNSVIVKEVKKRGRFGNFKENELLGKRGRGRPKGIPCPWKGGKAPRMSTTFTHREIEGKRYIMTAKMRKFANSYMKHGDETLAAKEAYNVGSHQMAYVLANRNLKHPLVIEYMQACVTLATDTIVGLARNAKKEEVRLRASQDILDRLGYKAPDRLEIDDKRELSDVDREAMMKVQNILTSAIASTPESVITEAEVVEDIQANN